MGPAVALARDVPTAVLGLLEIAADAAAAAAAPGPPIHEPPADEPDRALLSPGALTRGLGEMESEGGAKCCVAESSGLPAAAAVVAGRVRGTAGLPRGEVARICDVTSDTRLTTCSRALYMK